MRLSQRQREVLRAMWRHGPLEPAALPERMRAGAPGPAAEGEPQERSARGTGEALRRLIAQGLLREAPPAGPRGRRARPAIEINPDRPHVIGLSLAPGVVQLSRLNLLARPLAGAARQVRHVDSPQTMIRAARALLARALRPATVGIGIGIRGWMDRPRRMVLAGSAVAADRPLPLDRLLAAAGSVPVVVDHDTQALAAQWMLTHRADAGEDVLLVHLDEGTVSAAMLVSGRPNRGCVAGAGELGHTRFFVETSRCECGHTGCLQRICTLDFLLRQGARRGTLPELIQRYAGAGKPVDAMIRHLAMGLANAANLFRPHRVVLASRFVEHAPFTSRLVEETRGLLLGHLRDRVRMDCWDTPAGRGPDAAASLALASLYFDGWSGDGAP